MTTFHRPRVVIAGTNSGVGKTTIVTGLLAALTRTGHAVQPFKVGPDYIDPGFHALASGRDSYNLDTWLVPEEKLAENFARLSEGAELSIIEGVMGLYDGGSAGISSTAAIAKRLQAPVILVINVQSMGQSAGAIALGYKNYDPDVRLAGVIVNRVGSPKHAEMVRESIEQLGIPVLGIIHRNDSLQTPERHLGLTPVTETDPTAVIQQMAKVMHESIDLDRLRAAAEQAPDLSIESRQELDEPIKVRIAVAHDAAFSFYYPTSLQYLERLGAELVHFSPLTDKELPSDIDGIILGGGFPEMFLDALSENREMLTEMKQAADDGMPIYAECGGLMYLCESVTDFAGTRYPLTGIVPATTQMEKKLQRVGYVTATAQQDSIIATKGATLRGHEFHFSTLLPENDEIYPWAYELIGSRNVTPHKEGYVSQNVLASYLHLAWDGSPQAARRFLTVCHDYRQGRSNG